jgi:N6-L-threonylcarbamoyladenine synthase
MKPQPTFPLLSLIVSGGHSQLVYFRDHFDYDLLGQTVDDAIGEAFDKVAKIVGLPYPGGPSVAKAALAGNPHAFTFPIAKLDSPYNFSFSGLKTAVLRAAQAAVGADYRLPSFELPERLTEAQKCDLAASFQYIAIKTVVDKTRKAFNELHPTSVVIAGGVAANQELRSQLSAAIPIPINYAPIDLCTDNGAMIATLGCIKAMQHAETADPYTLAIAPNLKM